MEKKKEISLINYAFDIGGITIFFSIIMVGFGADAMPALIGIFFIFLFCIMTTFYFETHAAKGTKKC